MKKRKKRKNYHNQHLLVKVGSLDYLQTFILDGIECIKTYSTTDYVDFVYNRRPFKGGRLKKSSIVKIRII